MCTVMNHSLLGTKQSITGIDVACQSWAQRPHTDSFAAALGEFASTMGAAQLQWQRHPQTMPWPISQYPGSPSALRQSETLCGR